MRFVCWKQKKMYRWRFSIAIILGFLWYFSDYGRTLTQFALCFLCFPSTSSNLKTVGRESSTQTDEVTEKNDLLVIKQLIYTLNLGCECVWCVTMLQQGVILLNNVGTFFKLVVLM